MIPSGANAAARAAQADRDERLVKAAFARLDVLALAIAVGALFGLVVWLATVYLLLKGAPPGGHVGPHLGLLAHYLPLYSVTWTGSFFGLAGSFVIGFCIGGALAIAWDLAHYIWLMLIVRRSYQGAPL